MSKERVLRINRSLNIPISEIKFRFSRSGGPGGQNVNKIETKTELRFNIIGSPSLTEAQRTAIYKNLATRISSEGVLQIVVQDSRSQLRNREIALNRFRELLGTAIRKQKVRKPTSPTSTSKERRIKGKKTRGRMKRLRGRVADY
jgi:ribosome-associated protein